MNITVDIRGEQFLAALAQKTAALDAAMVRVITRLSIEIQSAVKTEKLSGQALHVRTGTLRRSINRLVVQQGNSVYGQVGTNVAYAAAHEYGFSGVVNVREFTRGKTGASVRAHTRQMNLPERSFLRSTLREHASQIREQVRAAAVEVLK